MGWTLGRPSSSRRREHGRSGQGELAPGQLRPGPSSSAPLQGQSVAHKVRRIGLSLPSADAQATGQSLQLSVHAARQLEHLANLCRLVVDGLKLVLGAACEALG